MAITLARAGAAISIAALCAVGVRAQTQETKTTTKTTIELKGGKDVTVRGCLDRDRIDGYVLNDVRDARRDDRLSHSAYALLSDTDLSKYVGTRVEIKGKAVEDGNGKVTIESKVKAEGDNLPDREKTTKTEATSGVFVTPYLGIKSIKTLSSSCR